MQPSTSPPCVPYGTDDIVTSFAVSGGGTSDDRVEGVAVDGAGAVVAAGWFTSSPATFGGVELTNAGGIDALLWKESADGTTLWAVRGGGTDNDKLSGVAVDAAGAMVAAGYFSNSSTFGGVALTNAGDYHDAVVWKMSADGTTLWAVRGGGTSDDELSGVVVDGVGAVVASGHFESSTATFGGVALTNAMTTGWGAEAVVWKMSADGTTLWAVRGGGSDSGYTQAIAVDGSNAVVAAGHFKDGTATFGSVALTSTGNYDAVVWKMSADGTTLWAVRGGGTGNDKVFGVAVDAAGAVVAAGDLASSESTFGGVALTTAGANEAVVWKMSADGTTLWAVLGGGTGDDYMRGIAADASNAVVAAGFFDSTDAMFGGVALTTAGSRDAVVWKMSADGTTLWAVRGGATSDDSLHAMAVDGTGTVVAAGEIQSSTATFGDVALTIVGDSDAVVWKVSDVAEFTHCVYDACSTLLSPFHLRDHVETRALHRGSPACSCFQASPYICLPVLTRLVPMSVHADYGAEPLATAAEPLAAAAESPASRAASVAAEPPAISESSSAVTAVIRTRDNVGRQRGRRGH